MASLTQLLRSGILIVLAAIPIAALTLFPASGFPIKRFDTCIVCGTYGSANFILNALLYAPLGVALWFHKSTWSRTLVICLAASTIVEFLHLRFLPGRYASLGDIVANSGGGVLGWMAAALAVRTYRPSRVEARRLVTTLSVAIVASAALSSWLFKPAPTSASYYGQINPVMLWRGFVNGDVSGASVNGEPLPGEELSPAQSGRIREQLKREKVELRSQLTLRGARDPALVIARVIDERGNDLAMIGIRETDALFAVRTHAAALHFNQPSLAIDDAFRCDSCAGGVRPEPLEIRGVRDGPSYQLSTSDGVSSSSVSSRTSPNITWFALTPGVDLGSRKALAVTAVWVGCQFFLLAYWLVFALGPGRRWWILLAAMGAAAASQVGIPAAMGAGMGTWFDWMAILAALATGWGIAALVVRRTEQGLQT